MLKEDVPMKKIVVGSLNPVKIEAVREMLAGLVIAEVEGVKVNSQVSDQPKSLAETFCGAKVRASAAFESSLFDNESIILGIGIESGFFPVNGTFSGVMNTCVCAIFDGEEFCFGMSPAFEVPPKVVGIVKRGGSRNLSDAFYKAGLTNDPSLGAGEGVVSLLTNGEVDRKNYTKEAIRYALTKLNHPEWHKKNE